MRRTLPLLIPLLLALALAAGCGDDGTQPPPDTGDGLIHGQIGDADFEYAIEAAGSATDPLEGPFILRGSNLHYDDELGALVVDLTVTNAGGFPHHEPIGLTFIHLMPANVTVLNPDNGVHGDGAAIVFHFTNDDGVWTPGETSFPRTVQFGVAKGVSIGFVARLDIGEPIDGGTIAGRVWNDADKDGVMDEGEPGLPGVRVYLGEFSEDEDSTATREFWITETGRDGHYAFDRLRAGAYVVSDAPATMWYTPTTPTEIHVLLTEVDGEVGDFLEAHFGLVPQFDPPFGVGTRVIIEGRFYEPDVFNAFTIFPVPCPEDSVRAPGGAWDEHPDCFGGRLRGPVTAVAPLRGGFKIMNTWVISDAAVLPFPIEVGMRLDVHVHRAGNVATWVADSIEKWDNRIDELRGRVDAVEADPNGYYRILVLDTWIGLPGSR